MNLKKLRMEIYIVMLVLLIIIQTLYLFGMVEYSELVAFFFILQSFGFMALCRIEIKDR